MQQDILNRKAKDLEELDKQEIKNKPNFIFVENDDFEKSIVEYMENPDQKTSQDPQKIIKNMLDLAFEKPDYHYYLREMYQGKSIKSGLCRKLLKNRLDVGY